MQVKRSIVLFASTLIGMLCLLITNKLITSVLNSSDFGLFSYTLNFFNFIQIITSFGVFYPLSRELAIAKDELDVKSVLGIGYVFVLYIFLIQLLIVVSSYLVYFRFYNSVVASILLFTLPFIWIFSANNLSEVLFQSLKSVKYLAFYRSLPRFIFMLIVGVFIFCFKDITILFLLYSFLISYGLVHIGSYFVLKPRYVNLKDKFTCFFKEDFSFGFNVYSGSLISLGAVSFTGLLIGFFHEETSEIGYYNLAIQLSVPLTLIPNVIATSNYSNFVKSKELSGKVLFLVLVVCFSSLVIMYSLSNFLVNFIYGVDYKRVSEINKLLIIGYFFYGIADCFNKFLLAKGFGKEIRNTSIIIGVVLLCSNLYMIPKYSAGGAAVSVIFAGILYLAFSVFYYLKRKNNF